jgi:hypothetical protein
LSCHQSPFPQHWWGWFYFIWQRHIHPFDLILFDEDIFNHHNLSLEVHMLNFENYFHPFGSSTSSCVFWWHSIYFHFIQWVLHSSTFFKYRLHTSKERKEGRNFRRWGSSKDFD